VVIGGCGGGALGLVDWPALAPHPPHSRVVRTLIIV
jgi:hypothetical protein